MAACGLAFCNRDFTPSRKRPFGKLFLERHLASIPCVRIVVGWAWVGRELKRRTIIPGRGCVSRIAVRSYGGTLSRVGVRNVSRHVIRIWYIAIGRLAVRHVRIRRTAEARTAEARTAEAR